MPDYRGRAWYSLAVRVSQPIGAFIAVALLALACQGQPAPSSAADPRGRGDSRCARIESRRCRPRFCTSGDRRKTYRLADFRGRQAVVLAWFAKAFTGP